MRLTFRALPACLGFILPVYVCLPVYACCKLQLQSWSPCGQGKCRYSARRMAGRMAVNFMRMQGAAHGSTSLLQRACKQAMPPTVWALPTLTTNLHGTAADPYAPSSSCVTLGQRAIIL